MKHYILLLSLLTSMLQAQTNRALIVTIGQYPRHSGWEKIHVENDFQLVAQMLKANQYLPQNIIFLSNSEATKVSVTNALTQLCNNSQSGDCIYLHFSCHGQQMMDDNGDEADGLDESIVLYDAGFWKGGTNVNDFMDRLKSNIFSARRRQTPYMECTPKDFSFRIGSFR